MNRNILVTGATGYLGSRFLDKLLKNNYQICVVKRETSDISKIMSLSAEVKFYNNDEVSIKNLFQENDIEMIVHIATLYGRKGETMFQIKEANLDFPLLILKYAIDNNVKYFINTGTSLPYLTNQYSLFKNQFSECLEFHSSNITTINILLEHFYGPGDDDSKFITSMIGKMKSNIDKIELTEGIQLRDFIFIEDVLDAYFFIINNINKFKGYNNLPLGSGETVTIKGVVETIKEITSSTSDLLFGNIPMRSNELMCSDADISILNGLGWTPKFNLNEGLKMTVESYNKIL
ncbi:NAD-dependent epimerase/dehydratase family protein [Flavobacterium gawalongense]|uniref:NAD(P)-dependent oxidoreductase n=1 Tax=Flavobacterium gawalongense TaxID=2594432 RepID=A0ABY3CQ95_9FLAO|nr:NAD(P)-dependent oxidoreductase [Flavobacterium gawalongense]TRX04450.1 NAD(P)-dependent oxidoreductase [Flavobacterium gawalongense]TRX10339.1 NAD(P)-dependent oxidoreductase [Flavobacterium gawalongense]